MPYKAADFPRCSACSRFGPEVLERAADQSPGVNGKKPGISWTGGLAMCPCQKAFYCSVECQRAHWPDHKPECQHGRSNPLPVTSCSNCNLVTDATMWCACGTTLYCSLQCQKDHWQKGHFEDCRPLQDRNEVSIVKRSLQRDTA